MLRSETQSLVRGFTTQAGFSIKSSYYCRSTVVTFITLNDSGIPLKF